MNISTQLEHVSHSCLHSLNQAATPEALVQAEKQTFGKKGPLKELNNLLKTLSPDEKRTWGPKIQSLRQDLETRFADKKTELQAAQLNAQLEKEHLDVTAVEGPVRGHAHPLSLVQHDVEQLFLDMGFTIADGPELETEWYNFDALNVPESHPARDMQDTFWVKKNTTDPHKNYVLRTQTSNAQIRTMQQYGAPLRMICPGRVYRNEATDATHDSVFYQVEGLMVDKGVSLTDLKGTLELMIKGLFGETAKVRMRPGYFPFVEPGLEVDMWWEYTDKHGQKQGKWLEFCGAGMVHPDVLTAAGVDPKEYTGFAFGFGLTRLAMMRYGIEDIRHLFGINMHFARQF